MVGPTIVGDQLTLRGPRGSDKADYLTCGTNLEAARMYGVDATSVEPLTIEWVDRWYDALQREDPARIIWVLEHQGRCIGEARLDAVDRTNRRARYAIGIFDAAVWNQGLGTEATRLVLRYAFETLGLHRVDLRVLSYNQRAIRCYEKCGFLQEGMERDSTFVDGAWRSDVMMSILEEEYREASRHWLRSGNPSSRPGRELRFLVPQCIQVFVTCYRLDGSYNSTVPENLLRPTWSALDSAEFRLVLDRHIPGPGQYSGRDDEPNTLYLPLAGDSCRISLAFKDGRINAVTRGPAFDSAEWQRICDEIDRAILTGPTRVGREFSFSSFRVQGSWRGLRSGVQILPPPEDAPRAPVEMAAHPFILEFPIREASAWPITNHRRMREHRRITLALNLLLVGRTSAQPRRTEHFWAWIPAENDRFESVWTQQGYFGNLGQPVVEELSPPAVELIDEVEPEEYYTQVGHDGQGLRVPADLDQSLSQYLELPLSQRDKFDRALFWIDMASRQWNTSVSASFAALVSAVESLTELGKIHYHDCPTCGGKCQHEVPGATERFRAFFEQYASGAGLRARRSKMYKLRSDILHGSQLMQLDQDLTFGWDPPWWNERELHEELWSVVNVALRNWLKRAVRSQPES
jgi:[ribosomal protein S5]-alanine N-acetyltransferase